jgi:hypothetical protein
MLHHVALVRTDVLEELSASIICSSKTLVLTRVTRLNIPENGILHSRHRENLRSYIVGKMLLYNPTFLSLEVNYL